MDEGIAGPVGEEICYPAGVISGSAGNTSKALSFGYG